MQIKVFGHSNNRYNKVQQKEFPFICSIENHTQWPVFNCYSQFNIHFDIIRWIFRLSCCSVSFSFSCFLVLIFLLLLLLLENTKIFVTSTFVCLMLNMTIPQSNCFIWRIFFLVENQDTCISDFFHLHEFKIVLFFFL